MAHAGNSELLRLIEIEIDLGFTFFRTATLAGSEEHRQQAIANSVKAYRSARHFLAQASPADILPSWLERLAALECVLAPYGKEPESSTSL